MTPERNPMEFAFSDEEAEIQLKALDEEWARGAEDLVEGHLLASPTAMASVGTGFGSVLRVSLPSTLEPPDAERFTREVMEKIREA